MAPGHLGSENRKPYLDLGGVALMGDSISADPYNDWWTQATATAGRTVSVLTELAVGGERTDQLLARIPNALTYHPTWISALIGSNDVGQDVAVATITANLTSIYDQVTDAGVGLVIYTLPPRGDGTGTQAQALKDVNAWLRTNHTTWPDALFVDWSDALSENANEADPIDAYFDDLVHPNATGRTVMAGVLAPVLETAPSL